MHSTPPRVAVTRTYRFSAAHFYYDAALSQAENERLFGKCANRHGHGHNYRLEVTVRGPLQTGTGMAVDLAALDRGVEAGVLSWLDHRNLNLEVPFFAERQPTSENLALFAFEQLRARLPGVEVARVRVYESDDLWAEFPGDPC